MTIVLTIIAACVFAEFSGYFVHRLLHSHRVRFLSRNHMIHHLRLYGPDMPKRSVTYLDATTDRPGVAGIGVEWIVPVVLLISGLLGLFAYLNVPVAHRTLFIAVSLGWGAVMFSYMHGALHLKNFWMLNSGLLRSWFRRVRKLHDIHHVELDDRGRMSQNFGICFFWFDRLFGTFQSKVGPFNTAGLAEARRLYAFVYQDTQTPDGHT